MPITAISRDWSFDVNAVRLVTTDTLATVETVGYLTTQAFAATEVNNGVFDFTASDLIFVYASDGHQLYQFNGDDFSTLILLPGGSNGFPAGLNGEIQYNDNGVFGGDMGFTTDGDGGLTVTGSIQVDNLNLNGNTITSTDTNGNVNINTSGTGKLVIKSTVGVNAIINDDTMVMASATNLATALSIVHYIASLPAQVNPGLINQLAYYAASGSAVSGLATATSAVLTTSSSVPTWASQLSLALGGTNANLTASNGGIFYSTATAGAILSGTATANQLLVSGSNAAPSWVGLSSLMDTILGGVQGDILYRNSTVWTVLAPGTSGFFLQTQGAAANPQWATSPGSGTVNPGLINQLAWYTANGSAVSGLATATTAVLTTSASVPTWASELSLALGGTNANLTASNGGIFYSTASAGAILAGTVTANQLLVSGSSAAPSWSGLSSLMDTILGGTQGDILYRNSTVWTVLAPGTSGFFLQTQGAAANPQWAVSPGSGTVSAGLINQLAWYAASGSTVSGLATATTAVLTTSSSVPTWAAQLSLALGGTNANLTASNGGIFYSTASAGAILAGTATANQVLLSGSSTTPAWSTATYPATATVSGILYASSSNVIGQITTANSATLITSSSGVPSFTASMTNGQVLIGSTGASPAPAVLTPGAGITVTNGAGSITIAATASNWVQAASSPQAITVNTNYIANLGTLLTFTLPATAAVGDTFKIVGKGAGLFTITQGSGQTIHAGSISTTTTTGSVTSLVQYASIAFVCTVANTDWTTDGGPEGTFTYV